jgi:cold shock CspA family protein
MPDSGGNRVYVHKSGIEEREEGRAPRLERGQRVEYQLGQRPKGPAAVNVRTTAQAAPVRSTDDAAVTGA